MRVWAVLVGVLYKSNKKMEIGMGQREIIYNLVKDRGDGDGPETADVRIGDESSDERCQAGGSTEISDGIGCFS